MVSFSPRIHEIVPYQAPKLNVNSWGGRTAPGEVVKLYPRSFPPSGITMWQFTPVCGTGDATQFVILNCTSGCYLTATAPNTIVSCQAKSPSDQTVRWTVKAAFTTGYDVFCINAVNSNLGQLNVSGSATTSGTDLLAYQVTNQDNPKFYLDLRLQFYDARFPRLPWVFHNMTTTSPSIPYLFDHQMTLSTKQWYDHINNNPSAYANCLVKRITHIKNIHSTVAHEYLAIIIEDTTTATRTRIIAERQTN